MSVNSSSVGEQALSALIAEGVDCSEVVTKQGVSSPFTCTDFIIHIFPARPHRTDLCFACVSLRSQIFRGLISLISSFFKGDLTHFCADVIVDSHAKTRTCIHHALSEDMTAAEVSSVWLDGVEAAYFDGRSGLALSTFSVDFSSLEFEKRARIRA